jgi:hypothetical protein
MNGTTRVSARICAYGRAALVSAETMTYRETACFEKRVV